MFRLVWDLENVFHAWSVYACVVCHLGWRGSMGALVHMITLASYEDCSTDSITECWLVWSM